MRYTQGGPPIVDKKKKKLDTTHNTEKLPPCTGQILTKCAVLKDASAVRSLNEHALGTRIKERKQF